MTKHNNKNNIDSRKVVTSVSNECLKKLKIIAIQQEITLHELVCDILERSVSKKSIEELKINE